jgi:hypothetical protein
LNKITEGSVVSVKLVSDKFVGFVLSKTTFKMFSYLTVIFYKPKEDKLYKIEKMHSSSPNISLISANKMPPTLANHYKEHFPAGVAVKLKKGDAVSFTESEEDDTVHNGIVEKGGKFPTVLFSDNGHKKSIKADPSVFTKIDKRELKQDKPTNMDNWGVSSLKVIDSLSINSIAFSAKITLNGKDMFFAQDSGVGGCVQVKPHKLDGFKEDLATFHNDLIQWFRTLGPDSVRDKDISASIIAEHWLIWLCHEKKYNITASEYLNIIEELFLAFTLSDKTEQ